MSEDPQWVVETMSKIVISGASGMIGTVLRRRLTVRGMPVLQLVRRATGAQHELTWDPAARVVMADPSEMEGCAAAIHLAGASIGGHRWTGAYKHELLASRVGSTRALAELVAGLRTPPRTLIVASAIGFYGGRDDEVLDEGSAPGTGFLASLCRQWEEAAQPAKESGIRVVHARFGVVLGKGPGALQTMLPIFGLGLGGRLGSGRQWMSWISLEDVVRALLFALDTPDLAGAVNVTAPNPVTNAEFTRALAKQLHRPAVFPAPAFALRLALGQMADEALLASARVVPTKLIDAGFRFAHPTIEAALDAALSNPASAR